MTNSQIIILLSPLILIQLATQAYALYDLWKKKQVKVATPVVWVFVILLGNLLGAILYFVLARVDSEES